MLAKGYTLLTVPVLVNESVMYGTGYFPVGRDQAYLCERDGMSLVGTAEVPVTAFHTDEVLDETDLPRKYVALSTCFRREAGAAGRDTHGLYRIHVFDKVEQVVLGPNDPQASVDCHQEKKALDLSGVADASNGWTRSYNNLAGKYGFYFHVSNGSINTGVHGGSRTIPGKFGARAAALLEYMDERHYDVKLSEEDRHRLTLWLDCNSEFYGSYENTEAQARGEVVLPTLN